MPDSFRGIHKGEGAGQKYVDEIQSIITKAQAQDKQVSFFSSDLQLLPCVCVCVFRRLPASLLSHYWAVVVRFNFLKDSSKALLSERNIHI